MGQEKVRRRSIVLHCQPTISHRSPLDRRASGDPMPRSSTRHVSAVDRRSLRSPEPADSTDVLDDSGTHHAPPDTGRRAATTRPLRPYVEPRLTDCWDEATVGSTTSFTRIQQVRDGSIVLPLPNWPSRRLFWAREWVRSGYKI